MNLPLVSVLMTSFNRELYIEEAIKSVLESTYSNFELIITDDRSTDRTVEIARQFEAQDKRVKVYINDQNLGDYPNRNKSASLATGKYLKYLDSDDIIYPYSIELMVKAMELYPDAGFCFCHNGQQDNRKPFPISFTPEQAYREHFFNQGFLYAGPGGTLIAKEKFDAVGGFSGIRMVGDYELWLKLAAIYPSVKVQPGLIWWRVHEGQEFAAGNSKQNLYIKMSYKVTMAALKHNNCPLSEEEKKIAVSNQKKLQARRIIKLFASLKVQQATDIFKHSGLSFGDLMFSVLPVQKKLL